MSLHTPLSNVHIEFQVPKLMESTARTRGRRRREGGRASWIIHIFLICIHVYIYIYIYIYTHMHSYVNPHVASLLPFAFSCLLFSRVPNSFVVLPGVCVFVGRWSLVRVLFNAFALHLSICAQVAHPFVCLAYGYLSLLINVVSVASWFAAYLYVLVALCHALCPISYGSLLLVVWFLVFGFLSMSVLHFVGFCGSAPACISCCIKLLY